MRTFRYAGMVALLGGAMLVSSMSRNAFAADDPKWVTVKGKVQWDGPAVHAKTLDVNKDQAHCLSKGPIHSEEIVVDPSTKGMKNVFVWITTEGGTKPPIHPSLAKPAHPSVEMDQPVCAFVPHSQGMREGQTLIVKNTAPVAHNVSWAGSQAKNPGGNVIVQPGKDHKITNLRADNKRPVAISCNIHGWMKGQLRVFDHPYFDVTKDDGSFEIKMVPAGKYKIWYWSDSGWKDGAKGDSGFPIEIKAGQTNDLGVVKWKP